MGTWQVAMVVVVLGACALILNGRLRSRMSIRHMQELSAGFLTVQRRAFKNVNAASAEGLKMPRMKDLQQNFFKTCQEFGIVYTIVQENGSYIHTISGKAPSRPQKFVIQSMLLLMLELTRQFEQAGYEDDPQLNIGESELETQFIQFVLTPEQHERLAQVAQVVRPIG